MTISKTIRILIIHFRHKNLKYQYVTIKIHSTISKLKKVRLKIALKSRQIWNHEAHVLEHSITWAQPPGRTYHLVLRALAVLIKICFAFTSVLHTVTLQAPIVTNKNYLLTISRGKVKKINEMFTKGKMV